MAVVQAYNNYRWIDGVVPFEISSDFPEKSEGRTEILRAINEINSRTNVSLINRTDESDYVVFVYDAKWCQSQVGRVGGRQEIRCAVGKNFKAGSLLHEILHCLGFYHEHQRTDRNDFVKIIEENVKRKTDFEQLKGDTTENIGAYDLSSIMQYPRRIANANLVFNTDIDTIVPKVALELETLMGQRGALSSKDAKAINVMYPVKKKAVEKFKVSEPLKAWQWILIYAASGVALYYIVRTIFK